MSNPEVHRARTSAVAAPPRVDCQMGYRLAVRVCTASVSPLDVRAREVEFAPVRTAQIYGRCVRKAHLSLTIYVVVVAALLAIRHKISAVKEQSIAVRDLPLLPHLPHLPQSCSVRMLPMALAPTAPGVFMAAPIGHT